MNRKKWIWISLVVIAILGVGGYFFGPKLVSTTKNRTTAAQAQASQSDPTAAITTTVTIRPAVDSSKVSAAGNIDVINRYSAMLRVAGIVTQVPVVVGDDVKKGDLLVAMDTVDLQRAVDVAQLNLDSSQAALDKLSEAATPSKIAAAQASLASVRENLIKVKAGPTAEEKAAAEATLKAAQQRYQDLVNGPTQAVLTQKAAALHKAEITLKDAQGAYDRIAYRDTVGQSSQAIALQNATIDYDTTKAAYEEATAPASAADLQDAQKNIETAKYQLNLLRNAPTAADLASAESQVASAESNLADLVNGPSAVDLKSAQINVQKSQLDLDQAQSDLAQAQLLSPMDGTVMEVGVAEGQKINTDSLNAVTLANLKELELNVTVAEVDIPKVKVGQPVEISIDALQGRTFKGTISKVVPVSQSSSTVVNYPVTIKLTDTNLDGVLPGMTAVATIFDEKAKSGWLVPTTAIYDYEGTKNVTVVRKGLRQRVQVTPGEVQGEWTVVQSPDLQTNEVVVGKVSSFVNNNNRNGGFGPGGGGGRPPD
jgi:HlyD family secretion protein